MSLDPPCRSARRTHRPTADPSSPGERARPRTDRPSATFLLGLVAGLVLILAPASALAGQGVGPVGSDGVPELLRAPQRASSNTGGPGPAGLRIFVDPVDGHIVADPSTERRYLLQRAVEESFQLRPDRGEPYTFVLPNGGTGAWVGDRFMTSTVAHVGPDGTLHTLCQHGPGAHPSKAGPDARPNPAPVK